MTTKGESKADVEKVAHDFTFKKVGIQQQENINALTTIFLQAAFFIVKKCDQNSDRTRALEKLQEAKFWAIHSMTHYPHNETEKIARPGLL